MPTIDLLPASAATDEHLVGWLTDLVNRVYAVAEAGLWVDGTARTSPHDLAGLIAAGEIAVARPGPVDGPIVGSVHVQQLDDRLGGFGMLVADPAHRGGGVGRDLIRFAEDRCRDQGRTVMRLELLVPRDRIHPTKAFLDAWYTRIGYRPVRTGTLDEHYPQLAPLLATPCDLRTYHKGLT